jgi:hypothetical protein
MSAVPRAHVTSCSTPARAIFTVVVAAAVCVACGGHPREPNVGPKVERHGGPQITLSADSVAVYGSGHGLPDHAWLDTHDWLHQQIGIDPRAGS